MAYKPGDEKKYFSKVLVLLIALAIILSGAVYYFVKGGLGNEELVEVVANGVDPGDGMVPSGPPDVAPPTTPPPSE